MTVETPQNVSTSSPETVSPENNVVNTTAETVKEAPKPSPAPGLRAPAPSPAQDLRDVQNLLVSGIFPGNMAPSIVRAYQLLEAMAKQVEATNDKKDPA
jgi:hypothetical protein